MIQPVREWTKAKGLRVGVDDCASRAGAGSKVEAHAPRVIAVIAVSPKSVFEVWPELSGTSNASSECAAIVPAASGMVFPAIPDIYPPDVELTLNSMPPEREGRSCRRRLLEVTGCLAGIASC